jgi:opacity protein-like surface antigen
MHARPAPPQLPPERNERIPTWDDLPEGPDRRFYLASILGADFGTLSAGDGPNATDQLFTTGAAVGMSFERPQGWIRTEFEGRYRDPLALTVRDAELGGSATVTARDGWSTMVNAWRDFEVTDRVAVYLGGGIGGGGYTVAFDGGFPDLDVGLSGTTAVTGFAWQAGTGASWLVTDRIALDLGYRWYAVDGGPATIDVTTPIGSFSDSVGTTYGASELLFTIRIFEPFRRWETDAGHHHHARRPRCPRRSRDREKNPSHAPGSGAGGGSRPATGRCPSAPSLEPPIGRLIEAPLRRHPARRRPWRESFRRRTRTDPVGPTHRRGILGPGDGRPIAGMP